MRYSDQEQETLAVALVASLDEYPAFDPARITFRGKVIPMVKRVSVEWQPGRRPQAVLEVVDRASRGYSKDDLVWHALMAEIRASGVTVVGWPVPGDPAT